MTRPAPGAVTQGQGIKADWYFDFISPYAYLQFATHPDLFERLIESAGLVFKPVVFAGLLAHWRHKGPVEIPEKRRQTYRMIAYTSAQRGIAIKFPPGHPFNPIPALRLAIALCDPASPASQPAIAIVRTIFEFIWKEGRSLADDWAQLCKRLGLGVAQADALIGAAPVKDRLRAHGEEAIARGIYGVPTFALTREAGTPATGIRPELFWGEDATPMLRAYLADPGLFNTPEMCALDALPVAASRKGS